ncbi:MAG: hypothetical protein ABR569_12090 [Gaiellaceae bacterium]
MQNLAKPLPLALGAHDADPTNARRQRARLQKPPVRPFSAVQGGERDRTPFAAKQVTACGAW